MDNSDSANPNNNVIPTPVTLVEKKIEEDPKVILTTKRLPEIQFWKVGNFYDLIMNVKQLSISKNADGTFSAELEVHGVMSAEKDPMNLDDINNLSDNEEFMRAAAGIKQRDY